MCGDDWLIAKAGSSVPGTLNPVSLNPADLARGFVIGRDNL